MNKYSHFSHDERKVLTSVPAMPTFLAAEIKDASSASDLTPESRDIYSLFTGSQPLMYEKMVEKSQGALPSKAVQSSGLFFDLCDIDSLDDLYSPT